MAISDSSSNYSKLLKCVDDISVMFVNESKRFCHSSNIVINFVILNIVLLRKTSVLHF